MKRKKRGSQRQRQAYLAATAVMAGLVLAALIIFMLEQYPVEFPYFWYYLVLILFTLLGIMFIAAIVEDLLGKRRERNADAWLRERKLLRARLQQLEAAGRKTVRKLEEEHAAALREDSLALRIADGLLARLPDAEIERFAASREFPVYKRAMERHRIR